MLPTPMSPLEKALWDVHALLDSARAQQLGIGVADEAARKLIAEYLRGNASHCDALGSFIARLEAEEARIDRELERLGQLRSEAESDRRRFRAHILNAMDEAGLSIVRGETTKLLTTRAPQEVVVPDVAALPDEFARIYLPAREARERDLRAALVAGRVVPGAELRDGGKRLVIR